MPYTTVADLIQALQQYHPSTPVEGLVGNFLGNEVIIKGTYPGDDCRCRSVRILFTHGDGNVDRTGTEWDGGCHVAAEIDGEWFLPYRA